MDFKEYLAIIRRRWLLFFPIFVLVVGAHLVWVSYGQTKSYFSTSKVIIGKDRDVPSDGSRQFGLAGLTLSPKTKEATITDYPVLRTAAELIAGTREFRSQQFKEGKYPSQIAQAQEHVASVYGRSEKSIEGIVDHLQKTVKTRSTDPEIVEIQTTGGDPIETLFFSWAVAEAASQYHNDKAKENIDQMLGQLKVNLGDAETRKKIADAKLNEARKELNVANFSDAQRLLTEKIYSLDDKDSNLLGDIKKNDATIKSRLNKQSFSSRIDVADSTRLASSDRVNSLRNQLFKEKIDFEALLATLSPKHPDVQSARAKIGVLERQLADAQEVVLGDRYKAFSDQTNRLISSNALLALEREVLAERRSQISRDLADLNHKGQRITPLESDSKDANQRVEYLRRMEKDMHWYSKGRMGTVVVYDPAITANPITVRGGGIASLFLTLLMALIFSLGVVYVVEYVDTRMKNEHDVRRHLNLPLLGIIPKESSSAGLLTEVPLQSEISEKFNTAATLIQSISSELSLRSLMICSAIAREGKTTVSVNLSIALARRGAKVVLIDGDLRISQIHNILRLSNHVGLANALDPRVNAEQIIDGVLTDDDIQGRSTGALNYVQQTQIPNLSVMTSGPPYEDAVHLLDTTRLEKLVAELKTEFDFVIFDTPPINKVGDALTISTIVDGSVFVVGSGQAEQHDVMWAKHLLSNVQANILGVFLNKFSRPKGSEYYYYYYYGDKKRKRTKSRA